MAKAINRRSKSAAKKKAQTAVKAETKKPEIKLTEAAKLGLLL